MFTILKVQDPDGALKRPEFRFDSKLSVIFGYRGTSREKVGNCDFIIWEKIISQISEQFGYPGIATKLDTSTWL